MAAAEPLASAPAASDLGARLRLHVAPVHWIAAATAVLGLSLLAAVLAPVLHHQAFAPEDDAEYYRVIARHIAATGASTFDGQTLTNGYHPLWMWMLALQDGLVGDSFLVTRLMEVALMMAAFPLLLVRGGLRTPLATAIFLALFGRLVAGQALTGMEISLFVGTTALLVWTLHPSADTSVLRGAWIGLALAAAILSRIDAAVFLLPLVVFAPPARRVRLAALAVAGGIGAAYAAYNLSTFGTALPLSSAVKSLGGLQLNHRFLAQLADDWRSSHLLGRYVQTFGLIALSPLFLWASKPHSLGRALAAATLIGGIAFTAKIAFDSSWRIWPWYNFPVLFGLLSAVFTLGPPLERRAARAARRRGEAGLAASGLAALLLVGLTGKAALALTRPVPEPASRFDIVNAEAVRRFAPVLRDRRVAMGDRAGAFAALYPGGVTQMEGLVNDRAWYEALKRRADLKPILCARGVRFVAAYQKDLGRYGEATIPAMRPTLTQFPGPSLSLAAADEVGHFADRSVFDMRGVEDEDDVFYLWRLTCEPHRSP